MKICTRCHIALSLENFYTSKSHKNGYMSHCKKCESERCKARNALNKEKRLPKQKEWQQNNKDLYYKSCKKWKEANKEKCVFYYTNYRQKNKAKVNARWMAREAGKKDRTPSWLTEDQLWMIDEIYDLASIRTEISGISWHVDHVIPLNGKKVSGLHVPWNLMVITAKENQIKGNKFLI